MDIIIVLTGKRGHGKDTVANIGINNFGCTAKVALAAWFKEELSNEFKIPLENFYSTEKDVQFEAPLVISRANLRNLLIRIAVRGYAGTSRIATGKWEGRLVNSVRELMLWFGHEFVSMNCGDRFHCEVTDSILSKIPRKPGIVNIFFVTDARQYGQSKFFMDKYKNVFPVLVVKPGGSADEHVVEKSVDEFPEGYFFDTIVNDGNEQELVEKVKSLLFKIKTIMTVGKTVPVSKKKPAKKQQKQSVETLKEENENGI